MRKVPFKKNIVAEPHSPIYTIHRYFARRPHNVFAELIQHYTKPSDIILDPFCGGGVTVIEALSLGRKVIGVDVNPLATYVTKMEALPLNVAEFLDAFKTLERKLSNKMHSLYETTCPKCKAKAEIAWTEWKDSIPLRIQYICPNEHSGIKASDALDVKLYKRIKTGFNSEVKCNKLWYPPHHIPVGDKTSSILKKGYQYFWQLFTERNLLALAYIYKEISLIRDKSIRDFLYFTLSASLKWASKQCHLRGEVVEGWALHAYWIYPKQLEINVRKTFVKRVHAVVRGKMYLQKKVKSVQMTSNFAELKNNANFLLLTQSSSKLPIPDNSVDCILTDPPYGGNVNYAELSDFWTIWHPEIRDVIDKRNEVIINRSQSKDINRYEELLTEVFGECHRVLKSSGVFVASFNSKDLVVLSSFLKAAAHGGFELVKNGFHYQEPIKAYTTTVHAKEVGAFTGDFIFTFQKSRREISTTPLDDRTWKEVVNRAIDKEATHSRTEIEFRRRLYHKMIPQLANWAFSSNGHMNTIARYAELISRKQKFQALPFDKARSIAR